MDEYADLRYDPNWKTKFEAELFDERSRPSPLGEAFHDSIDASEGDPWWGKLGSELGEHKGTSTGSRAPEEAFAVGSTDECLVPKSKAPQTPYHPPKEQPQWTQGNQRGPEHQRPPEEMGPVTDKRSDDRSGAHLYGEQVSFLKSEGNAEKPAGGYGSELLSHEQRHIYDSDTAEQKQRDIWPRLKQAQRRLAVRDVKQKQDIVERNKMTLGVSAAKQGSYLWTHGHRREKDHTKQELEPGEDFAGVGSQGSQDDVLDAEHRWQQKTQELKVAQSYTHKTFQKADRQAQKPRQRSENLSRTAALADRRSVGVVPGISERRRGLTPRVGRQNHAEVLMIDDADSSSTSGTSSLSAPPAGSQQTEPGPVCNGSEPRPVRQRTPTMKLNICLSGPSDARPLQQPALGHHFTFGPPWVVMPGVYPLAALGPGVGEQLGSLQALSYYSPRVVPHVPQLALPPSGMRPEQATGRRGRSGPVLQRSTRDGQHRAAFESDQHFPLVKKTDDNRPRILPGKSQPVDEQNVYENAEGQHVLLQYEESCGPNPSPTPRSAGFYPVLPPIGQMAKGDSEMGSQRGGRDSSVMQRSTSDGYLAQMEKQKQLRERMSYKAYTLKDYKSLQKDIKLGGLGPHHTLAELTAENIQRQRQYSESIREQKKKCRDPFPMAKVPVSKESKDMVVRRKALEYARNIPKPKQPSQAKSREGAMESFTEHAQYLEDLDISQLATLEMLQKRHEEEKQAVARFRALHAI